MAKIANVFGRLEAFSFSILLYILGYIQQAGSKSVQAFASAQIFYSAGATGLRILQQIFIADTSDLLNRALFSSLPDIPFLITVWAGAPLATSLLSHTKWRWGYAIWTIVLPVAFLPLALALLLNMRKAAKSKTLPPFPWKGQSFTGGAKSLWFELDVMGLLLLSAAISLILIPLTLVATAKHGWHNVSIIAMVVVGCLCFVIFPLWEASSKLAPHPFLPLALLTNRTVITGCAIGFFYFGKPLYAATLFSHNLTIGIHISRFLHLNSALFSLLSSRCPIRLGHSRRPYHANLLLHLHRLFYRCIPLYQIYLPLQILHHRRCCHLSARNRSHDPLPHPGLLDFANCRNPNCRRHRRWYDQCPRTAWRSGFRLS